MNKEETPEEILKRITDSVNYFDCADKLAKCDDKMLLEAFQKIIENRIKELK